MGDAGLVCHFTVLPIGGNLDADVVGPPAFARFDDVPGVGRIRTRWLVESTGDPQVLFITVRSEGEGAMTRARSRAQFTTVRTCTNQLIGCP